MHRSLTARAQALTNLDFQRLSHLPSLPRIALAGVASIVATLVADAVLVAIGRAVFDPPGWFGPFHFGSYAPLTVLGVVGATVGWAILVQVSSRPRWVLWRAAIVVTVVLLIPDFVILPSNPTGGVVTLMVMHITIAVVTYWALLSIAPASGMPVPGRFLRSWQPSRQEEQVTR
jgi:hypothetical protein